MKRQPRTVGRERHAPVWTRWPDRLEPLALSIEPCHLDVALACRSRPIREDIGIRYREGAQAVLCVGRDLFGDRKRLAGRTQRSRIEGLGQERRLTYVQQ